MPPARSRVVLDDARSDVSTTNQKDRVNSTAASKGKKASANASNGAVLSNKATGVPNVSSGLAVGVGGIVDSDQDHPHVWPPYPPRLDILHAIACRDLSQKILIVSSLPD